MPSKSRNTVRRNFSINEEASQAIDSFATEHNLTKSKVVERAVLEHTAEDTTARIEKKVDKILRSINGDDVPLAQTGAKKKNSRSNSSNFDPAGYDPDEKRDEPLSKEELNELVTLDEPVVNPEHIDENNLPGGVKKRTTLIAAVVRYRATERDLHVVGKGSIREAIENHLGKSTHILDQYTETVKQKFERVREVEFDSDSQQYKRKLSERFFPSKSHREEFYQEEYEAVQEAVNTPVDEIDGWYDRSYENLRQWLDDYYINETLQELNIATSEEIDDLQEELIAYRDEVDQCLTAIEQGTSKLSPDFSREEAIEAVPYDKEQSESIVELFGQVGYIGEFTNPMYDMGLMDERFVWRD